MNKSDLSSSILKKNKFLNNEDINRSIESILLYISNTLRVEDRIELRGFGSFSVKKRPRRYASNPSNQEKVLVEEKLFPYFRASKNMRKKIDS